ncbi:MAG: alpha/beta fold hydrolase [Rhizobiales bacterium]|nr:alpha/beta fold hydrolase [Hyphomicrobiales bacterium]OJY45866.1 MAG: hypothetical protein BGP08_06610 [Rhizobiales bacterium 64-17]
MPWSALAARTEGNGAPFILLHGGVGSSSHWTRNIEALARHYRVVAFDLPGYGASPDVPENLEPEHYIDWVAAAVDEAAGDGCELAGFSFGGAIAARIAARLGARIRHLSLLAPGGFGAPKGRVIPTVKVPSLGAPSRERRQAVAANLAGWMLSALPGVDDEVVDMQIYNIDHARFDSRRVSLRETLLEDLRRMTAPVQLMWGARDALAYPSIDARVDACRAARPGMPIELIEKAGHWVQFEQPERVNELLLKFHRS